MLNSAVRMLQRSAVRYADRVALEDGDVLLTYAPNLQRS